MEVDRLSPTLHAQHSSSRCERSALKAARLKLGMTQQMLADFVQVALPTIKRAERGETLRSDTVSLICQYFSERYGRDVLPEELGLAMRFGLPSSTLHAQPMGSSLRPYVLKINRPALVDLVIWKRCLYG